MNRPAIRDDQLARIMADSRATRSYRIGAEPSMPLWELVCCALGAAMIGAMLGVMA